jgi:CHAT domain-containing protein
MVEFYRNYLSGMSFSRSLQQVKIRMLRDQSLALPVNWAAYVLIGD